MRKVELRMNEQEKYETIKVVAEGRMKKEKAEIRLGISRRHLNRLVSNYHLYGKKAFQHGNRNRKPKHTVDSETRNKIVKLYKEKYSSFNFTHFTEKLNTLEGIHLSRTTITKILQEADILSPKAWRQTKKKHASHLKRKLREAKKKEVPVIIQQIESIEQANAHPSRPRKKYFGEQLQVDASLHDWFGTGEKATLHLAIDDASGHIVGAWFEKEETLNGYYTMFHQILTKYGIPNELKTDRRTVFEYESKVKKNLEEDTFTQFSYACHQLGVSIKTSSVPQAKGRVERVFGTLQSRLAAEFSLQNITTIEKANEFLKSYLKEFNKQFGLPLNNITSIFECAPSPSILNVTLGILNQRVINDGHHFRFQNEYFVPTTTSGVEKYFLKGTKVLVIKAFDGKIYASIGEELFATRRLESHEQHSSEFDEQPVEPKQKRTYIPPMSHPWKRDSFEKYLLKRGITLEEFQKERVTRRIA